MNIAIVRTTRVLQQKFWCLAK